MSDATEMRCIRIRREGNILVGPDGKRFLPIGGTYYKGNPDGKEYKLEFIPEECGWVVIQSHIGLLKYMSPLQ